MTQNGEAVIRRILVALDTSSRGTAAAQAAADLAGTMQAELLGLFVEDMNLLNLAGLPFAREQGLTSACSRLLDFDEIERGMRSQAAQVERLLARAAERQQLRWSFRVTRGHVVAQVLSAGQDMNLVVLGKTGRSITAKLRGPRMAGEEVPARRPVLLVFDGSEPSFRALSVAAQLARSASRALVMIIPEVGKGYYPRLRKQAEDSMGPGISRVRWHAVKGGGAGETAQVARSERVDIVVLPVPSDSRATDLIDFLLEAVDCPLVLVR